MDEISVATPPNDTGAQREAVQQKHQNLERLLREKKATLEREQNALATLQQALGIVDPQQAAVSKDLQQRQLDTLRNTMFNLQQQVSQLEVQIDQYKLELALAQDPAAKQANIEEEIHKDERIEKLGDQLNDIDGAIAEAKTQVKGGNSKALERLQNQRDSIAEKIATRRDELQKRLADTNEAVKVKEAQGKLAAAEKHKQNNDQQLAEVKEQVQTLEKQLANFAREAADLENRKVKIRTLEQMIQEMERDLEKLQAVVDASGTPATDRQ